MYSLPLCVRLSSSEMKPQTEGEEGEYCYLVSPHIMPGQSTSPILSKEGKKHRELMFTHWLYVLEGKDQILTDAISVNCYCNRLR